MWEKFQSQTPLFESSTANFSFQGWGGQNFFFKLFFRFFFGNLFLIGFVLRFPSDPSQKIYQFYKGSLQKLQLLVSKFSLIFHLFLSKFVKIWDLGIFWFFFVLKIHKLMKVYSPFHFSLKPNTINVLYVLPNCCLWPSGRR